MFTITHKCFVAQSNSAFLQLYKTVKENPLFYKHDEKFTLTQLSDYESEDNVLQLKRFTFPLFEKDQRIFGKFASNRFDYLKEHGHKVDKITIIENPVDRVYEAYSYFKQVQETDGLIGDIFREYKKLVSLDVLIDGIKANPTSFTVSFPYKSVVYKLGNFVLNQFENLNEFAFVGTVDKLQKSVAIANNFMGEVGFVYEPLPSTNAAKLYSNHRRKDLESALSAQLEEYNRINDML